MLDIKNAPWIGNEDYYKDDTVTQEDYDCYWQDDIRDMEMTKEI